MWYDEIGRTFCNEHRREQCHECCYDFSMMNRMVEVEVGLRKPPSELETLAEQRTTLMKGIKFLYDNRVSADDMNLKFHNDQLKQVEDRIAEIRAGGESDTISDALRRAEQEAYNRDAELSAIGSAWAKQNPGKSRIELGGSETQKLYDKFASKPPSSSIDSIDKLSCGYCGASSAEKLRFCSACRKAAYCNVECQKLAWKGHKKVCLPIVSNTKDAGKSPKLPITWEQLKAFGRKPAKGKVLEVRVMQVEFCMRQFLECKDRVGVVMRIAMHTNSRSLPGVSAGMILRWKNPLYNWVIDGRSGVTLVMLSDEELVNVSLSAS